MYGLKPVPFSAGHFFERVSAGAKAHWFYWLIGTTEVVPCYKAREMEFFRGI
jgi:hypothetical protein